jgi:hypothetical protein
LIATTSEQGLPPPIIYYTTDGSTPTTSSLNAASPITGIIVSTNSTFKFFAKDILGNASPVMTATYLITQPPMISSLPPGGTYESPQSVTLTASRPSTIFYTTDGSTPTTSSNKGQAPISGITINTNSTLKFFAKDSLGNTSPINSVAYTILSLTTVSASPPGGTYNAAQLVMLNSSRLSTIQLTVQHQLYQAQAAKTHCLLL